MLRVSTVVCFRVILQALCFCPLLSICLSVLGFHTHSRVRTGSSCCIQVHLYARLFEIGVFLFVLLFYSVETHTPTSVITVLTL